MMKDENSLQPHVQAAEKLKELLHCGNERIELSAAKEILALAEDLEREQEKNQSIHFAVSIHIVGEDREDCHDKADTKDA